MSLGTLHICTPDLQGKRGSRLTLVFLQTEHEVQGMCALRCRKCGCRSHNQVEIFLGPGLTLVPAKSRHLVACCPSRPHATYAAILDERHVFFPHRLACPSTAHAFGPCPAISAGTLRGRTCVYLETAHMFGLRDRTAQLMKNRVLRE